MNQPNPAAVEPLPELPEPFARFWNNKEDRTVDGYDAEQMHDYARATLAAAERKEPGPMYTNWALNLVQLKYLARKAWEEAAKHPQPSAPADDAQITDDLVWTALCAFKDVYDGTPESDEPAMRAALKAALATQPSKGAP